MAKYFVFLYLDDPRMREYLNLAIAILNPRERWPAHITIAGPFKSKLDVPRALTFSQEVYLLGRGRFEAGDRHTVFLHVGSRNMSAHIEKPDYPDAVPHLSLYSGTDREIADLLFQGLGSLQPYGVFYSRDLQIVESREQYSFDFKLHVDPAILPSAAGRRIEELCMTGPQERVNLALNAIRRALMRNFSINRAFGQL